MTAPLPLHSSSPWGTRVLNLTSDSLTFICTCTQIQTYSTHRHVDTIHTATCHVTYTETDLNTHLIVILPGNRSVKSVWLWERETGETIIVHEKDRLKVIDLPFFEGESKDHCPKYFCFIEKVVRQREKQMRNVWEHRGMGTCGSDDGGLDHYIMLLYSNMKCTQWYTKS